MALRVQPEIMSRSDGKRLVFAEALVASGLMPPDELSLAITSECNLHCRYCSGQSVVLAGDTVPSRTCTFSMSCGQNRSVPTA